MKYIIALVALAIIAASGPAQSCRNNYYAPRYDYHDYVEDHHDIVAVPVPYAFFAFISPTAFVAPIGAPVGVPVSASVQSGGYRPAAQVAAQPAVQPQVAVNQIPLASGGPPEVAADASAPTPEVRPTSQGSAAPLAGAIGVLQQHCASCHSGAGKGGVSIFDASGQYKPSVPLTKLYAMMQGYTDHAGQAKIMPPAAARDPSAKVPEEQRQIVLSEISDTP